MTKNKQTFQWECHPQAEALLLSEVSRLQSNHPFLRNLEKELADRASTRLFDWVDHLELKHQASLLEKLQSVGFEIEQDVSDHFLLYHPGALLPRVVLRKGECKEGVALKVEHIEDFLMTRGLTRSIEGGILGRYRRCCVSEGGTSCWVVERRGDLTMEPSPHRADDVQRYLEVRERWATRTRSLKNEEAQMLQLLELARYQVEQVGEDLAAWIFFEVERDYWQARNRAARIQKGRQDELGMGWANHDHHTYRSSRKLFPDLIRFFQILGFHCRERFYAGTEAGWGAQVMENPHCNIVLFLDVDLSPEEISIDFLKEDLPEIQNPGTVGLWCLLHGDSILKAGMHHLEAQFYFDDLKEGLKKEGIGMMRPFSDFTYLRQAFTEGERWPVEEWRLNELKDKGILTEEQVQEFKEHGALGSHLENLQRREGYKGFNQNNVSWIIKKTDPRVALTS